MLRVYECITAQHDLRFVVAAALICLFACYTALNLLTRAKLAEGRMRPVWIATAAVVAGSGIWALHFMAMLAFNLDVPVRYDLELTVASIVIAIAMTWCGFLIAMEGGWLQLFGGLVAGLAIASMHYVGMAAVQVPAEARWAADYVVASVLIGAVLVPAALKLTSSPDQSVIRHLNGASLYALGIAGLHFTAMTAVTYIPDPRITLPNELVNWEWLSVAVASVTVLIIALGFTGSVVDQHLADRAAREARRLRRHVEQLEATRKELEETAAHLKKARDDAAANSEAKSRFLAAMSHELRTPLNAVIGFAEILANESYGPLGDERYREHVNSICDSGAHLLALISDVLDVTKIDAGGLELAEDQVDLRHVVERAVGMVAQQAEQGAITLTTELAQDLPRVRADERRLRQVLLNLLSNAVKFTPKGGAIRVTDRRRKDGIAIEVADTGIGIAPEDIPRAFERFGQVDSTLKRRFEGTGLGLPLSRGLMEMHGGTLTLESAVGAGTTVTVTIPESRVLDRRAVA